MRITDPQQAYLDQKAIQDYDVFLETLHECLNCGGLFNDPEDMSNDIDICQDCFHAEAPVAKFKKHFKLGEQ